jgi:hypothetical protein
VANKTPGSIGSKAAAVLKRISAESMDELMNNSVDAAAKQASLVVGFELMSLSTFRNTWSTECLIKWANGPCLEETKKGYLSRASTTDYFSYKN